MNKFKKFIITKILRESICEPVPEIVIAKEPLDVEKIGIDVIVSSDMPTKFFKDELACRIGRRLLNDDLIRFNVLMSDNPYEKRIQARIDVVRQSKK